MPQTGTGTITLYNKKGAVVTWKDYKSVPDRTATLEKWRKTYGKHFQTMTYGIEPNISAKSLEMMERADIIEAMRRTGDSYEKISLHLSLSEEATWSTLKRYRPELIGQKPKKQLAA